MFMAIGELSRRAPCPIARQSTQNPSRQGPLVGQSRRQKCIEVVILLLPISTHAMSQKSSRRFPTPLTQVPKLAHVSAHIHSRMRC